MPPARGRLGLSLGVTEAERGDLEKVKTRFRKMSLKCRARCRRRQRRTRHAAPPREHPDKNMGREEAAAGLQGR